MKTQRIHLEVGVPTLLRNTISRRPESDPTVTLVDFSITGSRASWCVRLDDGSLIESVVRVERPLPYWPGSLLALALPVKLHVRRYGALCPEFILRIPEHIEPEFVYKGRA